MNIGINQLIISGDRLKIFNIFSGSDLNFSNYEINELSNNQFCTMFHMSLEESTELIELLSTKHPDIEFKLFYADKLLSQSRILTIRNNETIVKKQNLKLTLQDMTQTLSFEKAFKDLI